MPVYDPDDGSEWLVVESESGDVVATFRTWGQAYRHQLGIGPEFEVIEQGGW